MLKMLQTMMSLSGTKTLMNIAFWKYDKCPVQSTLIPLTLKHTTLFHTEPALSNLRVSKGSH